jgi:inorganic pyrophosphatase
MRMGPSGVKLAEMDSSSQPKSVGTDVHVVVGIPKGSCNKYELRPGTDGILLDRHLFTATQYPADYGFIHDTLGEDGDPLDVLVLLEEPTFPGCHLWGSPIGDFWMSDDAGPDAKILFIAASRQRFVPNSGDLDQST